MKKYTLNVNSVIANFVVLLNIGLLRKLRFIRIPKIKIYLRLLAILYNSGLIRTLRIRLSYIEVFFKFKNGQPIGKYTLCLGLASVVDDHCVFWLRIIIKIIFLVFIFYQLKKD